MGGDDDDALIGHAPACERLQAQEDGVRQGGAGARVEAQLDGALGLVDLLPAGTGGADEVLLQFVRADADGGRDFDHGRQLLCRWPRWQCGPGCIYGSVGGGMKIAAFPATVPTARHLAYLRLSSFSK